MKSDAQTDPQNAALLAFKREQIGLMQGEATRYYDSREVNRAIAQTQKRAAQIEKTVGDAASTTYSVHERAYFAPDGSPQPFWVALPAGYNAAKKWPLAVYLHGYSENISKIAPWFPPAEIIDAATKRGLLLAIPYGRRNSDFVQWGEDDVLQVKNEVMRLYSIDEKRVFLAGASMGGYGAWAVGLHDVSPWRAVAPICGRTDFYLWFKTARENLPVWKRALYDADDPRFLLSNARSTPFFVQHGALDGTVSVEHSRRIASDAKRLGLPLQYLEQADGDHGSEFQTGAVSRAFSWFLTLPPVDIPQKIELVAVDLREAKNNWARIEAFETYGQKATLKAEIQGDVIAVTTENVASFALEPPPTLFATKNQVKLVVNGAEAAALFDAALPIRWQKEGAKSEKSPARCGPFKNLLRDPFLLVYGDEKDRQAAQKFALEWKVSADGNAKLKSATEISDVDKTSFNLILFGTRDSNPLLGEIAAQLPLELTKNGVRSGEENVEGKNLGLRMIWKSPWDKARLIGICSGIWWGDNLPVNHKWDLIPDYIVYNQKTERDASNVALEAGFFDGNWGK
ncbi:prolyl oligopeptidase family serine peptidase [Abditibacterium utsteinense]|uniref:carboxylesterase family protein n=1 Tax=Abditibacterium utsteinense TaxID=1960156 RepID=UPI0013008ABE|nr:prolyl oligopeptidase family serine peptidase [Abditibacterium utsteinense]